MSRASHCPPDRPSTFPPQSAGRAVVRYIPEGWLLTAGEGKPGSCAPEASGQRRGGGRGGCLGSPTGVTSESARVDRVPADWELHCSLGWIKGPNHCGCLTSKSAVPLTGRPAWQKQTEPWKALLFQAPGGHAQLMGVPRAAQGGKQRARPYRRVTGAS